MVRICATTDVENDTLVQLEPYWLKRPKPGESVNSDSYRARHSRAGAGPSIYVPPALHEEIPHALLISDYEVEVTSDLRILNRSRLRRDFSPHHQGQPFQRILAALDSATNPLLVHTVRQFVRTTPSIMFSGVSLSQLHTPAAPSASVMAPDGTRFNPETGELD